MAMYTVTVYKTRQDWAAGSYVNQFKFDEPMLTSMMVDQHVQAGNVVELETRGSDRTTTYNLFNR